MPKSDMEWLFSSASEISAQRTFSDRIPSQRAFDKSLETIRNINKRFSQGIESPTNLTTPRKNVLHFYGIGGIGKTELLERLYQRIIGECQDTTHWDEFPYSSETIACYFDLSRHNVPTIEKILLGIRHRIANESVKCPAFDLLLARYWAINHPSDDLEKYLRDGNKLEKLGQSTGLTDQIATTLGDIATGILDSGAVSGTGLFKLTKTIISRVENNGLAKTALANCPRLEEMSKLPPTL